MGNEWGLVTSKHQMGSRMMSCQEVDLTKILLDFQNVQSNWIVTSNWWRLTHGEKFIGETGT